MQEQVLDYMMEVIDGGLASLHGGENEPIPPSEDTYFQMPLDKVSL